jgi:hypothetical protein
MFWSTTSEEATTMKSITDKSVELAVYMQVTTAALLRRTREGLAGEEGQTSAEYIGIILVIAAVIAAVVALNADIGKTIADEIKSAIQKVSP